MLLAPGCHTTCGFTICVNTTDSNVGGRLFFVFQLQQIHSVLHIFLHNEDVKRAV